MSPTESEAPYVLDGLMNHETKLKIEEHFTDTGGVSDRVFGLFALLGRRFAPRIRDLTGWRFYTMEKADSYPALKRHIGGVINIQLIRDNWDQLLRLAASMNDGHVSPSTLLKKLAAYPKQNQLARALQELGRIERTLFMIEWYSNPALRRRCQVGLNKGEAANKLKRAVFFHERGEIRDRVSKIRRFGHPVSTWWSIPLSIGTPFISLELFVTYDQAGVISRTICCHTSRRKPGSIST
jgi:TnpA family transposase